MIFYRITTNGTTVDWERTQADAIKHTKLRAEQGQACSWKQEDVPTDSHGLCAWLKANALGERKVKQSAETPHPTTPPQSNNSNS